MEFLKFTWIFILNIFYDLKAFSKLFISDSSDLSYIENIIIENRNIPLRIVLKNVTDNIF